MAGCAAGDHVVLSWNPHCGHCFYCERDQPILCETYLRTGRKRSQFDGDHRGSRSEAGALHQLMFLGAFAEYCVVPDQQAIRVPSGDPVRPRLPDRLRRDDRGGRRHQHRARSATGDTVMVIGCGAVGLSAVQGARLAGAGAIIAVDLDDAQAGAGAAARRHRAGRRRDAMTRSRRSASQTARPRRRCRVRGGGQPRRVPPSSVEAVRPGGEVIWLGKIDVDQDVSFRWGSLMGEKRILRSSYGGARPARDFPLLARLYLEGKLSSTS